MCIT
jgi:hypothetical protein